MNIAKSKISLKKGVNYLRELSVVIMGIAITLGAQSWLVSRNEQKDIKLYLNAVRMELATNRQIIERQTVYLEEWTGYARYLESHDKKSLNPDSIRHWNYPGLGHVSTVVFQTSAFEMFKTSGLMRLMKDKELLQSVWDAYNTFEAMRLSFELFYQLKIEDSKKEMQLENNGKTVDIPLYHFFVNYAANFGLLEQCEKFTAGLNEIMENIDKVLE